jgi:hypothetical protein
MGDDRPVDQLDLLVALKSHYLGASVSGPLGVDESQSDAQCAGDDFKSRASQGTPAARAARAWLNTPSTMRDRSSTADKDGLH